VLFLAAAVGGMAQTTGEAAAHLKAGAAFLQRGEAVQAVAELKAAIALQPDSAAGHMLLGQAYLAQRSLGLVAEAKAELQQALDIDPTLFWARFYLARVYMDLGRYDRAQSELEKGLAERPKVAHFIALLGEVKRKLGSPEASLELNAKALAIDPALSPAHYHRALAYMDLKRDDEAIAELETATQSKYVAGDMCLTLGSLYMRKRRYKEAENICKRGIQLDPSRSEGYLNLAQLYNAQGQSDKALAALKQALPPGKTFPTSPYFQQVQADIFFERGRAYQAKKMTGEAMEAYSMTLAVDPGREEAQRRLAELRSARR
jgi:tetratricopeptide (TPR) repeat protein